MHRSARPVPGLLDETDVGSRNRWSFYAPTVRHASDQLPPSDPPAAERISGGSLFRDVEFARPLGFRPLLLDLRVPASPAPAPLVVHIHGGGFATGSHKTSGLHTALVQRLLPVGCAVAGVQHRHSREAPFPAQLHDVKAAIRWLRRHSRELHLDPARFATWGSSSGGHLSTMAAVTGATGHLEGAVGVTGTSSAVQAAVAWSAPVNIGRLPPPPEGSPFHATGIDPHDWLVGGTVREHPDRASTASTSTHITSAAAPLLVVHGTEDDGVPIDQAEEIVAAYRDAGAPVEFQPVVGAGHVFDDATRDRAITEGIRFLDRNLVLRS